MKLEKSLFYLRPPLLITLLLLTISWIVFMTLSMSNYAPLIDNMENALEFVKNPGTLFYINYISVVILTIVNTLFLHYFIYTSKNNQIGYIDALSNLSKLKILDLSNNQIDDISSLFEFDNLECINIIDNRISINQIERLNEKGIVVTY
jgi:hypothetical protein